VHIPVSTYRLQFNYRFTFADATALVPYLSALGITDCYSSPFFKALSGSLHGYDIVDPTIFNPEIGANTDFQTFTQVLHAYHMEQILDVVPNHMSIAQSKNSWWQDVLENGPSSRYANTFDIDWAPMKPELANKVLLPILGNQYGLVLENQEITLHLQDGRLYLQYYDHQFPLDPSTWILVLIFRDNEFAREFQEDHPHVQEFKSIVTALSHLPVRGETDPARVEERYREKEVIRRRLATLCQESPPMAHFLDENIRILNGAKGVHRSFDLLDALVSNQAYRLAYWRVAAEEINYRRFFDINELAAIRIEQPGVFHAVHSRIFDFLRSGAVKGLRIDHVDGLFDPRQYVRQWQQWALEELQLPQDAQGRSIFLIVEKILGKGEALAHDWPIHGTTGYDFLATVNNLFIDTRNRRALDETYQRFVRQRVRFEELAYTSKKLMMNSAMSSEINTLGHQLNLLSESDRRSRDFTLNSLTHAIREIIACFPVYRTYITEDPHEPVTDRDRAYIRLAVARAKRKNPAVSNLVFDFIRELLLKLPGEDSLQRWEKVSSFVMKFQQTTSPVSAKGIEDTAFYIYNRLVSLNEVGSEPDQFGIAPPTFHERMVARAHTWPQSLSATETHDTKRGEDVRCRLNVLSELPLEWRKCLTRWHRFNKKAKLKIDDQLVPDRNEEYLLYQTLLGTWPWGALDEQAFERYRERIQTYMKKALREAKVHTSWMNQDENYERAMETFIGNILTRPNRFLQDFLPFQQKIAWHGLYNSLAQVLLKITAPGIPDFYQGTELWSLTLVDPDNRRPVNYERRQRIQEALHTLIASEKRLNVLKNLLEHPDDGRIKMFVTMTALTFRKNHASVFLEGNYTGLTPQGDHAQHLCAFARVHESQALVTVTPRFLSSFISEPSRFPFGKEVWGDTWIPVPSEKAGSPYRHIFTGEILHSFTRHGVQGVTVESLFQHFPLAALERLP